MDNGKDNALTSVCWKWVLFLLSPYVKIRKGNQPDSSWLHLTGQDTWYLQWGDIQRCHISI